MIGKCIGWTHKDAQSRQEANETIQRLQLKTNKIAKQKEHEISRRNTLLMKISKLLTKKNRRLKKYKEWCIIYQKTIDAMQQNRVDAGVKTENDPAAMDEVRSQMIMSTTDSFGMPICRSSSSINSMNEISRTLNTICLANHQHLQVRWIHPVSQTLNRNWFSE